MLNIHHVIHYSPGGVPWQLFNPRVCFAADLLIRRIAKPNRWTLIKRKLLLAAQILNSAALSSVIPASKLSRHVGSTSTHSYLFQNTFGANSCLKAAITRPILDHIFAIPA